MFEFLKVSGGLTS